MEVTGYLSIYLIGLSYGATACMFSCMPFLTPLLFSGSNSTKEAIGIIVPFSIGRIFSYTLLSILAFWGSYWLKRILDDTVISSGILGTVTFLAGLYILVQSNQGDRTACHTTNTFSRSGRGRWGLFAMGASLSLNPCTPVLALLGFSINATVLYAALFDGIFFGLGAVTFSILFYGFLFSKLVRGLLAQFQPYRIWIERGSGLFLMALGLTVVTHHLKL